MADIISPHNWNIPVEYKDNWYADFTNLMQAVGNTIGWVNACNYTTLELANTAAYNAGKLLVIAQNYTLTANTTLTAAIQVIKGGSFTKASTYTLTINGSFEAGLYQVFSGFATGVTFGDGTIKEAIPHWWYSGSGDWSSAIQSALASYRNVYLPAGTYPYATTIQITDYRYFYGAGLSNTFLSYSGSGDGITNLNNERRDNIFIHDFELKCTNASPAGYGMHFTKYCSSLNIERVAIMDFGVGAIYFEGGLNNSIRRNKLHNNDKKKDSPVYGIRFNLSDVLDTPTSTVVEHNHITGVKNTAVTGKAICWESMAVGLDSSNIIEIADIAHYVKGSTDIVIKQPYLETGTIGTFVVWENSSGTGYNVLDIDAIATWTSIPANRRIVPSYYSYYLDATKFNKLGSTQIRGILQHDKAINIAYTDIGDSSYDFGDSYRVVSSAGWERTYTLPASTAATKGRVYTVQNDGTYSGVLTIVPTGTQTINGAANYKLHKPGEYVTLICDGVNNWRVIGSGGIKQAANADTSGATLLQLETEVNELKAILRNFGILTP